MTPNQIKQISQSMFEDQGAGLGKLCLIHRFFDNSDLMNRGSRGHASLPRSPSDYLVTIKGRMFYAEIKGTELPRFSLARIEPSQWGGIFRQYAAGGKYYLFIWSTLESKWMVVSGEKLIEHQACATKSFKIEGTYNDWTEAFS